LRAGLAVAALCAATIAHADYKDNYALGLKAYNDGDYAKARELMQQALAEHPEPAARIRLYGQRWEAYLPQYYLGMVAFKKGDCAGALAQWNASVSRQVVAQLPEINSAQQRDSAACEQKVVAKVEDKPKPPPTPQEPAVKATVAENPAAKPAVQPVSPPPVAPKPVDTAPEPTAAPAKRVDVAVAKPTPPVVTPPVVKPPPPSNAPPAPLEEAFDNYLAGRYAKVARLNPEAITDTRARFHAYMVRAAARFTLAQISNDNGELDGARADARAAHALDGRATPDAAFFSPRFRTFFGETR
jgi:tetratricopeptide (TPR) repeat protein